MLPAQYKGNALAVKQNQYLEQRKAILENHTVQLKLTENDLMIAQAGVETPIRAITDDELVVKTATATKWICRDVGIKDWDNPQVMKYDAARFLTILKKYYKDLTLKEVRMAFELAAVGELDEWLPKDKNGEPDKNHYQSFSIDYYTKILNAYRSKKGKVWHKARTALPAPELVITKEQREKNHKAFIQEIYDAFYNYKEHKIYPNFPITIFIKEFVEQGVIKSMPKASKKSIDKAYKNIILGNVPKSDKNAVKRDFRENKINYILRSRAESIEHNIAIAKVFDKLIEQGQDIKQVIK